MNEAVYRSPKWLRNIADFEVNTGDDIKGAPSKRKQKQLDEEEKARKEEERLRKEEEEIRQKEGERKIFLKYYISVVSYIYKNYKSCKINLHDLTLSIENELEDNNGIDFSFKFSLRYATGESYNDPYFEIYIKHGKDEYKETIRQGFPQFSELKSFLLNEVLFYYNHNDPSKKGKTNYYDDDEYDEPSGWDYYKTRGRDYDDWKKADDEYKKSKYDDYGDDYEKYKRNKRGDEYNYTKHTKQKPKETDEIANKRRRYELLKNVLDGHQRKLNDCLNWEKKNPGKVHPDTIVTKNEIAATKSKINQMNTTYKFESVYYLKHLKSILS